MHVTGMLNAPGGLLLDLLPLDSEGLLLTLTRQKEGWNNSERLPPQLQYSAPLYIRLGRWQQGL